MMNLTVGGEREGRGHTAQESGGEKTWRGGGCWVSRAAALVRVLARVPRRFPRWCGGFGRPSRELHGEMRGLAHLAVTKELAFSRSIDSWNLARRSARPHAHVNTSRLYSKLTTRVLSHQRVHCTFVLTSIPSLFYLGITMTTDESRLGAGMER